MHASLKPSVTVEGIKKDSFVVKELVWFFVDDFDLSIQWIHVKKVNFFYPFFFNLGSVLLVLVCAEVLSTGPALLPNPLHSHGPVLHVPVGFEEHDEVSRDRRPSFMESSLESSGFFSEDSEDGKNAHLETKDTSVDLSAMNGE